MARTGISIVVANTTVGDSRPVNTNTLLVVVGATAASGSSLQFELDTPYMIQSANELETLLGVTAENNADLYKQVNDFYAPMSGVNNSGTVLWVVGTKSPNTGVTEKLADWVRATATSGFQYRPRNIVISTDPAVEGITQPDVQTVIDELYTEGFATVCFLSEAQLPKGAITTIYSTLPDLSSKNAPAVGTCIVTNVRQGRACVGALSGLHVSVSLGTSVGDAGLQSFADSLWYIDKSAEDYVNTPCASVPLVVVNTLGDKQYIFARTRPPKNGLWWNDGATAAEATTSLSTIEASAVIAAMVDDLREFLTPYINTKVPCKSNGDIDPTYKQVVIDNARSSVIAPYVEDGVISDARITINAQNNDMIGTRTWEVTLEILDAPTLRWIDGKVFYVKSLE
jgi:hypothetical protein